MRTNTRKRGQTSLDTFFNSSNRSTATQPPGRSPTRRVQSKTRRVKQEYLPKSSPSFGDDGDGSSSSDVANIPFEPVISEPDEDDATLSPRRPKSSKGLSRLTQKKVVSTEENSVASSSSEVECISPSAFKGKTERKRMTIGSDSELEHRQPAKRRLTKGVRPPTPEDEEDLMAEIEEDRIVENRLRKRDKKSTYLNNLKKLQRRKRGQHVSSSENDDQHSGDEDHDFDNVTPFKHARPHRNRGSDASEESNADVDEETFIVDDDDEAPELPDAFSMSAHQDLRHHMKIVCQLFVHLAVFTGQDRKKFMEELLKDKYFSIPLNVTRRKIVGMRDSLVASSVWRNEFKKPLEKYPEFELVRLDFAVPGCDACHLGGRLSTLVGRLDGKLYDKLHYESLPEANGSDSESEGEKNNEKKEFDLGRFCAKRTRVFHRFTHWEYNLYSALAQEVKGLQDRSSSSRGRRFFVPVAYAGGTQPPEDLSDADGIMTWLDERGVIEREWRNIKEMMEEARNLELSAKKGENDD